MIDIRLKRDKGRVVALECSGHAGFDDGNGLDLVCAAVSALTGALGMGLAEKASPPLQVAVGDGRFKVDLRKQPASEEAYFLLGVIASSLEMLTRNYPGFVQLKDR
ncbi:unnamed protein product [Phaeothamnion confervicola]